MTQTVWFDAAQGCCPCSSSAERITRRRAHRRWCQTSAHRNGRARNWLTSIYDLADPDSASLAVTILVSTNGGASYTLPATSFSGTGWGNAVAPGSNKQITWNAGADWSGQYSANVRFRVTTDDAVAPGDMALIPAGSFTMGNCMAPSEGYSNELPLHTVYVSAFYMDKYW